MILRIDRLHAEAFKWRDQHIVAGSLIYQLNNIACMEICSDLPYIRTDKMHDLKSATRDM